MMTRKAIVLALVVVAGSTALLAKSIEYPPNNAEFFLQLPDDYKCQVAAASTKTNPDGYVIGIGPKVVIALTAMSGIENASVAKGALPELTKKFFVETLMFQELQGQGVVDGKIAREGGDGFAVKVLTAMG